MAEQAPGPVTGPYVWTSAELAADEGWVYVLSGDEIAEIDTAVAAVRERGLNAFEFDRKDFPLPRLSAKVDAVIDQVENGRGCALIRGLDAERYDEETLKTLYWGLGVHLGLPITQNARGQLISHVRNTGRDYYSHNVRGYTTNSRIKPHCDPADTVGLLCAHPAKQGGESEIASAMSVHNELLANHPEYLPPLYEGFYFDLRGEGVTDDPDEVTFHRVPVFSYLDGRLSCRFNAKSIIEGQIKAGQPLDGIALEAVEAVAELAGRDDLRYDLTFRRGDIQILSNHMILHARKEFEDFPEPECRRNLLRLWVNLRDGRKLAPEFADRLNTGPRGGIMVRPPEGHQEEEREHS
ncbi:MAG: TauD/TfdA family dioxygenase [Rhodospirillales bacterium]|nr:TauD/TfdA family dioxygenase [Alphaproteobacteria bacterium]MBL6947338.1 TauD/TfdA family dioxygenase [Rhodospirillales bacterium]